jgi:hypothetical protein
MDWPELIDYIFKAVVLCGGGYLLFFIKNIYKREIAVYKAQIDFLKETQIEKYIDRMRSFKEFYEGLLNERDKEPLIIKQEMDNIQIKHISKDDIIKSQKELISKLEKSLNNYESDAWFRFIEESKKAITVEHYNSVRLSKRGQEIILWKIKFNNASIIDRFNNPIHIKNEQEFDEQ